MENQLTVDEKQFLESEVVPVVQQAKAIVVTSDEERAVAEKVINDWKEKKIIIEKRFHPTANKVAARELYEDSLDTEKKFYEPFDTAIGIVKITVKSWDRSEALRVERDKEEAEKKRLEDEKREKDRLEAKAREEKAKAEDAAKKAKESEERAAAAKIELDEAKDKAAQAAVNGDGTAKKIAEIEIKAKDNEARIETQNAEQHAKIAEESAENAAILQDQAETVQVEPKFTPPPTPVKKLIWKARILSVKIVCRSIGEGLLPFQMVEIKPSVLNEIGKNYDGKTRIPGLEFYQDVNGRI